VQKASAKSLSFILTRLKDFDGALWGSDQSFELDEIVDARPDREAQRGPDQGLADRLAV
jgi:hypothetical protein